MRFYTSRINNINTIPTLLKPTNNSNKTKNYKPTNMKKETSDNSYRIELVDMEFFARHGCFDEEQMIGNKFLVNLKVNGDFRKAAASDKVEDALDYQELYKVVKEEMEKPSKILENVCKRILDSLAQKFPQITNAEVTVDKLNPPLGGKLYASSVTANYTRNKTNK
jgi:dihydroneopterin aldolase